MIIMKMIRNKKMFQKIMIILVFLILCNFVFPMYSRAFGGGKLLNPIKDLVLGIGDAVINLTQSLMLPKSPTAPAYLSCIYSPCSFLNSSISLEMSSIIISFWWYMQHTVSTWAQRGKRS